MRIIITGGTGLIGRPLAQALQRRDHEVIVLSRNPAQAQGIAAGVQVVGWDGKSAHGWGHLADGAGAIINLAGENLAAGRWSEARKQRIRQGRLDAGRAVVAAVEQASHKPSVLVQASAVGYYGPRQAEIITESSSAGSDFLAQLCVEWEASTAAVEQHGVRRVILRTGIVLSNEGGAFPKLVLPFRLFAGGPMGDGKQWYPWIHWEDQVRAICFLLEEAAANGPFNLSAPNPVTNGTMAKAIGQVMKRPALLPAPGFALRAVLGEMATVVLDGQRAIPQQLQALGFTFTYPTLEEALRQLLA